MLIFFFQKFTYFKFDKDIFNHHAENAINCISAYPISCKVDFNFLWLQWTLILQAVLCYVDIALEKRLAFRRLPSDSVESDCALLKYCNGL